MLPVAPEVSNPPPGPVWLIAHINDLPFNAGRVSWQGVSTPPNLEENMKNPLDSLWGTIISGLVLTLILYWIVKLALGS